jgi:hypothetical protein
MAEGLPPGKSMFKPGCSVCNLNAWFVAVCKPEDLAHRFEPIVAYSSSLLTPPYPEISHRMRDQWRETRREVGTSPQLDGPWVEVVSRRT